MSRVCAVSGKKALSGNKRSHSLHASRRKWNVNLQKVKVMVDGKPQRIRISARALKTLKAQQKNGSLKRSLRSFFFFASFFSIQTLQIDEACRY